jgi:phage tail sheath protein FI
VASARAFLQRWQREAILVVAVPLAHPETSLVVTAGSVHAEVDMLAFLRGAGVFEPVGSFDTNDASPASAFVQLAYPWPCTRAGTDLPEGAEPPDGLIAGLMAANALTRGTFHSVAGLTSVPRLNDVYATVPPISWGSGPDSPEERLAERVCLLAPTPDGITLQSDVTSSPDPAWRFGGASRLMGAVIRAARRTGEPIVFDGNGPAVWARVERRMADLLKAFWRLGALRGATADDAFSVRCDRSTMTQNDLDSGRLIVEISLQPSASIERITVVLDLASSGSASASLREAA